MISYEIYKIIHLFGLFGMFLSLGGLILYVMGGGTKADFKFRKWVAISHGVFLFLVLLGGFGMAARLQWHNAWPAIFYVKVAMWLVFGGILAIPYRFPSLAKPLWFALPILGAFVAYVVILKPF